ncbi:MAG TPA: hypothetical protein GX721_03040 [Firmicutes bacterium]|nr:hypothetical protein [Bacillota bacterium]
MVQLNAEDIIRGLKRLKSLAKQDILISSRAPDPELWLKTATARKEKYEALITLVEEHGVQRAYQIALDDYASLVALVPPDSDGSLTYAKGEEQALEIFFKTLGLNGDTLQDARSNRVEVGGA